LAVAALPAHSKTTCDVPTLFGEIVNGMVSPNPPRSPQARVQFGRDGSQTVS
jgi:hypothetical protein